LLELELAAGQLLGRLLSPLTNPAPPGERARLPLAVVAAVRARWPAGRPLAARISASDWAAGGTTADDAVALARALAAAGCDLVAVTSGGLGLAEIPTGRLYQAAFSDRVRNEAGVPTLCEGGITSRTDIDSVLAAGRADLCAVPPGTALR
jgi:anthraniloyl-CoA monooxygenase